MYLDNKYTTTYYRIINRAKNRKLTSYSEKHHIIPKSLGGSDEHFNLVELTAKEHFICHMLLVKMVNGDNKRKMSYALWLMSNLKNDYQTSRYIPNSSTYANIRKVHSEVVSNTFKGIRKTYGSFAGKKHTKKTIELQSKIKLGENNPNFGVIQKTEWNEKKSKAQLSIKKPILICEFCNISIGGHGNYKRWHGTNCRINKENKGEEKLLKN